MEKTLLNCSLIRLVYLTRIKYAPVPLCLTFVNKVSQKKTKKARFLGEIFSFIIERERERERDVDHKGDEYLNRMGQPKIIFIL